MDESSSFQDLRSATFNSFDGQPCRTSLTPDFAAAESQFAHPDWLLTESSQSHDVLGLGNWSSNEPAFCLMPDAVGSGGSSRLDHVERPFQDVTHPTSGQNVSPAQAFQHANPQELQLTPTTDQFSYSTSQGAAEDEDKTRESTRPKSRRHVFSSEDEERLKAWLLKWPYPSSTQRLQMAKICNCHKDNIKVWFSNARSRRLPELLAAAARELRANVPISSLDPKDPIDLFTHHHDSSPTLSVLSATMEKQPQVNENLLDRSFQSPGLDGIRQSRPRRVPLAANSTASHNRRKGKRIINTYVFHDPSSAPTMHTDGPHSYAGHKKSRRGSPGKQLSTTPESRGVFTLKLTVKCYQCKCDSVDYEFFVRRENHSYWTGFSCSNCQWRAPAFVQPINLENVTEWQVFKELKKVLRRRIGSREIPMPCTVCTRVSNDFHQWMNHELVHFPFVQRHTCLPDWSETSGGCPFCELFPDRCPQYSTCCEHSTSIRECQSRPEHDRRYTRRDHMQQHIKTYHLGYDASRKDNYKQPDDDLLGRLIDKWYKEASPEEFVGYPEALWCGFCRKPLPNWAFRAKHLRFHFVEELRTMELWTTRASTTSTS